jgi:hypothetical protein
MLRLLAVTALTLSSALAFAQEVSSGDKSMTCIRRRREPARR